MKVLLTALIIMHSLTALAFIINGEETNDYPGVVKLRIGRGICTGTHIRARTILTAAHCVFRGNLATTKQIAIEGSVFEISSSPMHPIWLEEKKGSHVDLALIHLKPLDEEGRDFLANLEIVPLSTKAPKLEDEVIMVGFGCDNNQTFKNAGIKRMAHHRISKIESNKRIKLTGPDRESGIAQTCPGDSGGPLLNSELKVIGVASTTDMVLEGDTYIASDSNYSLVTEKGNRKFLDEN